jgi:hypothetical protein
MFGSTPAERFWAKVEVLRPDDCWPWLAYRDKQEGYGEIRVAKKQMRAHRFAYELAHGPIPAGTQIDHVCHNETDCPGGPDCPHRGCCNPAHLEAVSGAENTLRGKSFSAVNARKTHCNRGHALDGANVGRDDRGRRFCRTCKKTRNAKRDRKSRPGAAPTAPGTTGRSTSDA